jgi:hypothetical protein
MVIEFLGCASISLVYPSPGPFPRVDTKIVRGFFAGRGEYFLGVGGFASYSQMPTSQRMIPHLRLKESQ